MTLMLPQKAGFDDSRQSFVPVLEVRTRDCPMTLVQSQARLVAKDWRSNSLNEVPG